MKKMNGTLKILIIVNLIVGLFIFVIPNEPRVQAITKIPDGGALYSDGYRAYKDARKVNKDVKDMWDNGKNAVNPTRTKGNLNFVRGGKDPILYDEWNGNRLIYDVYGGITNQSKKREWQVINSGGEPFFSFDGWAINQGHHHHEKMNQATYIGLVNVDDRRDKHIFKTRMMSNTSANPDIEHSALGTCPNDAFNRRIDTDYGSSCNMNYNYTQFRAYIPLTDLFRGENRNKKWEMYIINRVENQILFDELILPYETKTYQWDNFGKVRMESGQDTKKLNMISSEVIKQRKPRGRGSGWNDLGYFVPGGSYTSTGINESTGVANWYEVRDSVAGFGDFQPPNWRATNEKRWTASTFWEFQGSTATLQLEETHATINTQHIDRKTQSLIDTEQTQVRLGSRHNVLPKLRGTFKDSKGFEYVANPARTSQRFNEIINRDRTIKFYYQSSADVTIRHIDANTNRVIERETIERQYNNRYTVRPKSKGTFEDSNGNPYVATPRRADQEFSEVITGNRTIDFYYKADLPDPTEKDEVDGATEGKTKGNVSWELVKSDSDKESRIDLKNIFEITGTHFETRNQEYITNSDGMAKETTDESQHLYFDSPNALKDNEIDYSFEYEYTNNYWSNYECVEVQDENCFEWKFVDHTPAWEDSEIAKWNKTLTANHKQGETFTFEKGSSNDLSIPIGEKATIDGDVNTNFTVERYNEKFTVDRKDTELEAQTWKEINEEVIYDSDFDNKLYVLEGTKAYYPNDIDENMRSKYENKTNHDYSDYAIPLMKENDHENKINFIPRDNFYVSKNTGLLFSEDNMESRSVAIDNKARDEYVRVTSEDYNDTVLTSPTEGNRYYLNIDLNSEQEPDTWYDDNVVIGKLGLNDVELHLLQQLKFDHYLFGLAQDDPFIAEQQAPVLEGVSYTNTVTLTTEQVTELKGIAAERSDYLHSFRSTDIFDVLNRVKEIVPSLR